MTTLILKGVIMNIKQLKNLGEVVRYWKQCLAQLNGAKDTQVAYDMVRVVSHPEFHDWYDGPKNDLNFAAAYDYLTDLELPDGPDYYREAKWQMVRALVRMLDEKYPDRD